MRPVSAEFLSALRGSHSSDARARVVEPGQTGWNPDGVEIPVITGDIQMDAKAQIRSTLDLSTEGVDVSGNRMWPSYASDLLAPYGNEIYVERGTKFGGTTTWVPLGYFRTYTPEQEDPPDGPIRIAGRDRMSAVIDGKLLNPVQFAASRTRASVVDQLVSQVLPGVEIEWDSGSTVTLGRALVAEEDRYEFLNNLVTSAGKIWYFDARGALVIKAPPSPSSPVWDVDHGKSGVLVEMSRDLTREGIFNGVVATGEGSDTSPPARAVAVDGSTRSPTYWYGGFGQVPTFYSSSFITTKAQAFAAASALLARSLGAPYVVEFGSIVNPALEVLDPIRVIYPDKARSKGGSTELHIIERLTVPLSAEQAQSGTTREQPTFLTIEEVE